MKETVSNNEENNLIEIHPDEIIKNISIIAMLLYPIIRVLLDSIIDNHISGVITYFIIGCLFIPGVIVSAFENIKSTLIMVSSFIFVVIVNFILHFGMLEGSTIIIAKSFITCYLMFMIIVNIKDKKLLFQSLKIGGYITVILTLIYIIIMRRSQMLLLRNGLAIQLVLIIFLPINLVYAFKEKKIINIIFTIAGLIMISIFSSRTIILVMWGYTFLMVIANYIKWCKNMKNKRNKIIAILFFIIVLISIVMCIINIQTIADSINKILNSRGIYNRTIRLLAEGEYFSNTSGRTDSVYPAVINKILEKPILGYGIGMDRVTSGGNVFYAHNIILEFYASYGIILGTIIILVLISLIIKSCKNQYRSFIIALVFGGLLILMLTSSYTIYRGFWLLLGVMINLVIESKGEKV